MYRAWGAFDARVRWRSLSINDAAQAMKPAVPRPNLKPPSAEDAGDPWAQPMCV